eukprot:m.279705 g.279705  ORF g.279705 m.279705 type:complete len:54 (-) comp123816_c0_seq1:250-411(-)
MERPALMLPVLALVLLARVASAQVHSDAALFVEDEFGRLVVTTDNLAEPVTVN